jgi:hypothetical protein
MPKTFTSFEQVDGGVKLRFVDLAPGPGMPNDEYVVITDDELKTAFTQTDVSALIQTKLNIKVSGAGVSAKLTPLLSTQFTPSGSGTPPLPSLTEPSRMFVTAWSRLSIGGELAALAVAAPASVAWGTANLARFVPFVLPRPVTVLKMFWYNGATVSGNVDVGIYNESLTRLVSMGSTAQVTINVIQEANVTDIELPAGRYYMALASSSATATFFCGVPSIQLGKSLGLAQQASALPLPATATLVANAAAILPYFGFATRTLVV